MTKLVCSPITKRPGVMPGLEILWWALRDSNPEPRDYESPALTVAPRALMNGECNSNRTVNAILTKATQAKFLRFTS